MPVTITAVSVAQRETVESKEVRVGWTEKAQGLPSFCVPPGNGDLDMTQNDDWSPDEPLGTEAFEQGDEALDDESRIDPNLIEEIEQDPSREPTLQIDDRELEEAGAEFDDPEGLVTLDGGIDDPDGLGEPTSRTRSRADGEGGWDLDAPLASDVEPGAGDSE
jgi:hypothetical protein